MNVDPWTITLQAVNVLALLWLLQRFLYRPVRQVLEERRLRSAALLAQAREGLAKLASDRAALARQQAGLDALREKAEAQAQAAGAAERARILEGVEAEAARRAAAAAAQLQEERLAAQAALGDEAAALAIDITRRLLQRQPEAIALGPFLREACAEAARLSPASRPGAGDEVEVVTDHALGEVEQARFGDELKAAIGGVPRLRFRADAGLLAGVELRLPHAVIRSHWAQDLATIREALRHHADAA